MLNPHSVPPVTLRKVAAAAAVGNFVEWFDFAVYGFLATVIAAQFFRRVCRRRRCCKPLPFLPLPSPCVRWAGWCSVCSAISSAASAFYRLPFC